MGNLNLAGILRNWKWFRSLWPDHAEPFGEDMIVRQVRWRLCHPETGEAASERTEKMGMLREIFVGCDPALSPFSSDSWRRVLGGGNNPDFEVLEEARYNSICRSI